MHETGSQMGIASTARVICGSETRQAHAKAIQAENREWVTLTVTVCASGTVLPPQLIPAAKRHQLKWFEAIPESYYISVSENGGRITRSVLNGFKISLDGIQERRQLADIDS